MQNSNKIQTYQHLWGCWRRKRREPAYAGLALNNTEWAAHPPPAHRSSHQHRSWCIHPPPTARNKTQSTMLQNEIFICYLQRETQSTMLQNEVFIHHLQQETKHRAQYYRMKYSSTIYREKQNTENNATEWSSHLLHTERNKTQRTMLQNEVLIHHIQKHRAQCYRMKYLSSTYREKQNTENNATEWSINPPHTERNKIQRTMLQNEVFIHHLQRETKHRAQCYRMKYSSATYREKLNTQHDVTEQSIHPLPTERNKTPSKMLQNEAFIQYLQRETKHRAKCYRTKHLSSTYREKQNTERNATEWSIYPVPTESNKTEQNATERSIYLVPTERNKTPSKMLQNKAFIQYLQRETKHRAKCYRMKHSSTTYREKQNTEHNAKERSSHI